MEVIQRNGVSLINIDKPLVRDNVMQLCSCIVSIGNQEPHKIVLNLQMMAYISSAALMLFFRHYASLFERGFILEIQEANDAVVDILKLANFNMLANINPENKQ